MKNLFAWCIPIFFICSCGLNTEKEIEPEIELLIEEIKEPELPVEHGMETNVVENFYQSYEGEIEGGIPIELNFIQIGNMIQGEMTYKKIGVPIPVIGTVENSYYRILEFAENGEVTGIISGDFENDSKNLSWFSPTKRNSLKMELELKVNEVSSTKLEGGEIDGKYHYQFGKDGHAGTITAKKVGKDSIFYNVTSVTQAPAHNMADAGGTLFLDGNKASVDFKTGKYEDCAYDINFYKDFVYIKYVNDRDECGFGHNAHVSGIFKRVKE